MCQVILSRVKSWTWQQLSLTNSFVILRYPCWAMCLWPPSKAGGRGQGGLIHQISIGSQKWSLTLKPSSCITATYNNSSSEKDGHYYTPMLLGRGPQIMPHFDVISQLSSVQIKSWKFSITQVKSFLFSSCRCANKLVKKFSITKTLEVSIE